MGGRPPVPNERTSRIGHAAAPGNSGRLGVPLRHPREDARRPPESVGPEPDLRAVRLRANLRAHGRHGQPGRSRPRTGRFRRLLRRPGCAIHPRPRNHGKGRPPGRRPRRRSQPLLLAAPRRQPGLARPTSEAQSDGFHDRGRDAARVRRHAAGRLSAGRQRPVVVRADASRRGNGNGPRRPAGNLVAQRDGPPRAGRDAGTGGAKPPGNVPGGRPRRDAAAPSATEIRPVSNRRTTRASSPCRVAAA